jgi:hypothetical protein
MKKKIVLVFVTFLLLLTAVLTGCSSGIPKADLDAANAQLATAQAALAQANTELESARLDRIAAQESSAHLQGFVDELNAQIAGLKAQYEMVGLTTAQIAEQIVKNYHAIHVYSTSDMFICGDMSAEVSNVLKSQGIGSVIAIGDPNNAITDILQSNHAWVLADIGGGQKLALETTAGVVMTQAEHPLYYHGWYFSSPSDLKANNDLIKEYNVRVGFRNLLAAETNSAMALYNSNLDNPTQADKYMVLYTKLKQLKDDQETILIALKAQIDGFATRF